MTARLIHLNGPPGVGKSTLARRYGEDHPGTFVCDIDALRTMVAGWQEDFHQAGSLIRTTAIAAISAYLGTGHDVVLPQLVGHPEELARFRAAATDVDAEYVGILIAAAPDEVVQRFRSRSLASEDAWTETVTEVVDELGGDEVIRSSCAALDVLARDEGLLGITGTDVESTYAALVAALGA